MRWKRFIQAYEAWDEKERMNWLAASASTPAWNGVTALRILECWMGARLASGLHSSIPTLYIPLKDVYEYCIEG